METNSKDEKEMMTLNEKADYDTKIITPFSNNPFLLFHKPAAPVNTGSVSTWTLQNSSIMSFGVGSSVGSTTIKSLPLQTRLSSAACRLPTASLHHYYTASTNNFHHLNIAHADIPGAQLLQGVPKEWNVGGTPQNVGLEFHKKEDKSFISHVKDHDINASNSIDASNNRANPEHSYTNDNFFKQGPQYGEGTSNIPSWPKEQQVDASFFHPMMSNINAEHMEKINLLLVETIILKESYAEEQKEIDRYIFESRTVKYPSEQTFLRIEKLKEIPRRLDEKLKSLKVQKMMLPQQLQTMVTNEWKALEWQAQHMTTLFRELERRCIPHLAAESSKQSLKLINLPTLILNQWASPSLYQVIQLWLLTLESNGYLATSAKQFYVDKVINSIEDKNIKADILQTVNPTFVFEIVDYLIKNYGQPAMVQKQLIAKHHEIGRIDSPIEAKNAERNHNRVKMHLAVMNSGLAMIRYFDSTYGTSASSVCLQDGVLTQWYMHTLGTIIPTHRSAEFILSLVKLTAREKWKAFHKEFEIICDQCFVLSMNCYSEEAMVSPN